MTVNTNNRNSSSINQIDTNDNDLNELVELNKDQNQINDIYDEPSAEEDNNDIEKEENQAIEHLIESTNENYQILADFKSKQIYAGLSEYDILIYPILFWNGKGGCGKLENESKFYSSRLKYSVISMCMQSPDYYFNQCSALREEFICSVYGRLIQLRINYEFNRQKQLFMKKEISPNMIQKDLKYGIKTYIPSSFTGSAQYWKKVTNQGFYLTLILGPPKFFVTITFNPKWNEVTALNNNEALLINNSPLIARIFNQKRQCFIDYIKKRKIFGNIEGLLWRVEYQQRGYPHCHLLIWSDFDTDDVTKIDKLITCKLPMHDPYEENNNKWGMLRNLSQKYMTHKCTSRCKDKDGNCIYGYPKEKCDKTHKMEF